MLAAPQIVGTSPSPNSIAPADVSPEIEFDQPINAQSARDGLAIFGSRSSNVRAGTTISVEGNKLTLDHGPDFSGGEKVRVTATAGVRNNSGEALATPTVWEFTAATTPSSGVFAAVADFTPSSTVYSRMGDLNGDGRLDAILVKQMTFNTHVNVVYMNDGDGLVLKGQFDSLGGKQFELGDLDGDGDLDMVAAANLEPSGSIGCTRFWLNDGLGGFALKDSLGGGTVYQDVTLGDVDADGDLDAFATGMAFGGALDGNRLWLNDGRANFVASTQTVGPSRGGLAEFGDLDNDGDLDLVGTGHDTATNRPNTRAWLNDGRGRFTLTSQVISADVGTSLSTGDIDGDGDLDFLMSIYDNHNIPRPSKIYLNDGTGRFIASAENFLPMFSNGATLGDIDGDGDLDAFIAGYSLMRSEVFLNDGAGHFSQHINAYPSTERVDHVSFGDLDGDGDLDMITASATPLWINKDADVDVAITIDDGRTHVVVGDEIQYTLTVTNFGPDDVSDVVLSQGIDEGLTDVRWTSVTSGGATSELSGEGAVGETVSLPVGASVVYTIDARIIFKAEGTVETWFSAQVPARSHDLNPRDNRINDTNAVWQSTTHGRSFAPEPVLELEGDASDSSLVDIDGDGDIDIVSAVSQGIAVYRNDGFMNFTRSSYGRSGVIAGLDTGDVDRDGDIDVLTSRGLWLNNGIGQLTASPYPLPVATNVGLGDLDSDGDLDAVLGGAQASIYVNDGSGRFSSSGQLLDSNETFDFDFGDADGNGTLDIVATHDRSGVQIYLMDGSRIYDRRVISFWPSTPRGVRFGDLDSDGDLDLLVGDSKQFVWLNDGDANFSNGGQSFPSSVVFRSIAVGDVDADGDLDAFAANQLFRNDGSAHFTIAQDLRANVGGGNDADFADLDLDGDLDVVLSQRVHPAGLQILSGFDGVSDLAVTFVDATPTFVPGGELLFRVRVENQNDDAMRAALRFEPPFGLSAVTWTSAPSEGAISSPAGVDAIDDAIVIPGGASILYTILATADAQLLGSLTLRAWVAVGEESPQRYMDPELTNNSGSHTATPQLTPVTRPGGQFFDTGQRLGEDGMSSVALGDLDGDGDLDALAIETNNGARVWQNDGSGRFLAAGNFFGASGAVMARIGDLDGDKDLDAFLVGTNGANSVWINNGHGLFVDRFANLPVAQSSAVALGDLDGDRDIDAFVVNADGQPDHVYWNDGQAGFVDSGLRLGAESGLSGQLGDLDGDGDLDALVADVNAQVIDIWKNDGQNGFKRSSVWISKAAAGPLAIGDLDSDGDLDLAVPAESSVFIVSNEGSGTFRSSSVFSAGHPKALALADLNGDQLLDIFVVKGAPTAGEPDAILFNRGEGRFMPESQALGSSAGRDVALADLDRDGDADAFVANGGGPGLGSGEVWRNGPLAGDTFPFDGVVDLDDLNNVRNHFGETGENVSGDADADYDVDLQDLNLVRNNFGSGSSSTKTLVGSARPAQSAIGKDSDGKQGMPDTKTAQDAVFRIDSTLLGNRIVTGVALCRKRVLALDHVFALF